MDIGTIVFLILMIGILYAVSIIEKKMKLLYHSSALAAYISLYTYFLRFWDNAKSEDNFAESFMDYAFSHGFIFFNFIITMIVILNAILPYHFKISYKNVT